MFQNLRNIDESFLLNICFVSADVYSGIQDSLVIQVIIQESSLLHAAASLITVLRCIKMRGVSS